MGEMTTTRAREGEREGVTACEWERDDGVSRRWGRWAGWTRRRRRRQDERRDETREDGDASGRGGRGWERERRLTGSRRAWFLCVGNSDGEEFGDDAKVF